MHVSRRKLLQALAASGALVPATSVVSATETGRFLVEGGGNARSRIEDEGYTVLHELADGDVLAVEGPADAEALRDVPGVSAAAADVKLGFRGAVRHSAVESTDEPFYPLQWDKQVTDAAEAHDTSTGEGADVAVLDTGVDVDHPDLVPNLRVGDGRLFRQGAIHTGVDEVERPVDFDDLTEGTTTEERHVADDLDSHGTHVAGIAAADDDTDLGIVGMAPDADVVPLRVFWWTEVEQDVDDDGETETVASMVTTTIDILLAVDYARALGVDAMNLSLSTDPLPPSANSDGIKQMFKTVTRAAWKDGTAVVVSAGNDEFDFQHGGEFSLPNSLSHTWSVSATAPNDELAVYSNFGTNEITVGAPGGAYETAAKSLCQPDGTISGCDEDEDGEDDGDCDCDPPAWPYPTNFVLSTTPPDLVGAAYQYKIGTSMAAPQVTGLVALLRAEDESLSVNELKKAVEKGATGVKGKSSPEFGAGIINAANSVERVADDN